MKINKGTVKNHTDGDHYSSDDRIEPTEAPRSNLADSQGSRDNVQKSSFTPAL